MLDRKEQAVLDDAARTMLGHQLRARAFFRRSSLAQLRDYLDTIQGVLKEKKEEEEERLRSEAQKEAGRRKILKAMQEVADEHGVSLDEVVAEVQRANSAAGRRQSGLNLVKYKCVWRDQEYFWKGTGRVPQVFKAAMVEAKCSKGAFLLPEEDQYPEPEKIIHKVPKEHQEELAALVAQYNKSPF